jgi:hypothetical protein
MPGAESNYLEISVNIFPQQRGNSKKIRTENPILIYHY